MICINQPYFFPYLGFFQLLFEADTYVVLDNVSMKKKSWITRNYFWETDELFTLKVFNLSQNRTIEDHWVIGPHDQIRRFRLEFEKRNKNDLFSTEALELIDSVWQDLDEKESVSSLNVKCIKPLTAALGINCKVVHQRKIVVGTDLHGADLLIGLCLALGDRDYLNLSGGKALYSEEYFKNKGINLNFIRENLLINNIPKSYQNKSILKLISVFGINSIKNIINNDHMQRI